MRLGTGGSSRTGGDHRGRRRVVGSLALAVLSVAGSVVVPGAPAGSAERDGRRFRDRGDRGDSERTARRPNSAEPRARMPARFVAELGGRIVIVSANTGRVERHLTAALPGGGARQPTVSPDGRTVWFSRRDGTCAAHLASVPVGGGTEEPVPGSGDAGPEGLPLPRPGRAQLAYGRVDCTEPHVALIVGDVEGREGHGQMGLVPMAWNRSGDRLLAATTDAQVRLVDVNGSGAIVAIHPLAPTDPEGCRLGVIGFSPDDNDGYLAVRRCGSGDQARRSLVLLDKGGAHHRTVVRLSRGQKFVDHVTFDATGHSLLYSTAPSEADGAAAPNDADVSLWLWRDGETRPLARQSRYRHPSWLP